MTDPIVDEVRRIRNEHAARFNYDLDAIFRDIKEQEKASGLTFVSYPPQLIEKESAPKVSGSGISDTPVARTV